MTGYSKSKLFTSLKASSRLFAALPSPCRLGANDLEKELSHFSIPSFLEIEVRSGAWGDTMLRSKISLKARALRFLSIREHSRLELTRKLASHVKEGEDLDALLNFLESANFLSNQRFSESLVNRRQARFGNQKILAELQSHALNKDDIDELKTSLNGTEGRRATDVLHRKFSGVASDSQGKAKQMRFLLQRGFSSRAVQEALRAEWEGSEV